jgi:hypothetical protein
MRAVIDRKPHLTDEAQRIANAAIDSALSVHGPDGPLPDTEQREIMRGVARLLSERANRIEF